MTNEAIVAAAIKMETTKDLLRLLNKIKMSELGKTGYPFIMPHLNYFIHPARNKKSYSSFDIPKKTGGVRTISAPTKLLKSFLTYTNRILQAFYHAPGYVTGFVPGKSVIDNAECHVGKNYVFNTDLKDFFPSISKSRVWATLKRPPFKFNDTIADAIAGMCCTEMKINGEKRWVLPQGSPCSPILSNIICRNLDRQLHKLATEYHLHYSRYADDISFSSNRNVFQKGGEFQQKLEEIITGQNFSINKKKTRVQKKSQRQVVTGLVVNDLVNVTREYVRGLDNLLYIWERYGESEAYAKFLVHYKPKQNLNKTKPSMPSVIQGKLLYLKMIKGTDNNVWRRLQRRFNKLIGTRPATESATIRYRYTIASFEKKIGQELQFKFKGKDVQYCFFTLNGQFLAISLSRYAKTRITNIANNNPALLEKFKKNYMLICYEQNGKDSWRIERKRKGVKDAPAEPTSASSPMPDRDKTAEEALQALIDSYYDLHKSDEWDN